MKTINYNSFEQLKANSTKIEFTGVGDPFVEICGFRSKNPRISKKFEGAELENGVLLQITSTRKFSDRETFVMQNITFVPDVTLEQLKAAWGGKTLQIVKVKGQPHLSKTTEVKVEPSRGREKPKAAK